MQPAPMEAKELTQSAEQLADCIRDLGEQKGMVASELEDLDREHADILHRFENARCLHDERSRLATRLAVIRRRRRMLKDWNKLNEPLLDYLGTDNGKRLQHMVNNLIGVGRKVEERSDAIKRAAEMVEYERSENND